MKINFEISEKFKYEIRSFLTTFLAAFLIDCAVQINTVLSGDLSRPALLGVLTGALKTLFKIVSTLLIPKVPTSLNSTLVPDNKE